MNKYELTVVVNAKIEDDVRVATVEKVKEYVARYGGTVTNVDEWGKKRLAYEIQKMKEGFYYFIQFEADATAPAEIAKTCPYHGKCYQIFMRKTGSINKEI